MPRRYPIKAYQRKMYPGRYTYKGSTRAVPKTSRTTPKRRTAKTAAEGNSGLLANVKTVEMIYYENQETTVPTVDILNPYLYRMNGINDPNLSGIGTQPLGHDQMALYYKQYTVVKCKAVTTFFFHRPADAVGAVWCYAFVSKDASQGNVNDTTTLHETYPSQVKLLKADANNRCTITTNWDAKKFWNHKDLSDEIFLTDFGYNPSVKAAIYKVGAMRAGDSVSSTVQVSTHFTYTVVLREPKNIAGS
jgi:hypothetical protein